MSPLVFALGATQSFASEAARYAGVALAPVEEREFEDGEHKTRPLASVRERDVYVVHTLHGDDTQSANDKLVRLLLFIGALKDASAARVTAVMPYLAYARKDRRTKPRDPVATRYVAQMFEAVGVDRVVTLDVHNVTAYQNAFRCRAEHLEAAPVFVRSLEAKLEGLPVTVVSPDSGGVKRADDFRRRLRARLGRDVDLAFAEKHRSEGVVSGDAFAGDVAGKVALVVDDLIASGTTMARAASACLAAGAVKVLAVATHGVFATPATDTLAHCAFEAIYVTDSVPLTAACGPQLMAKLVRVSVAPLVGEAIARLHDGSSLVDLGET